MRHLVFIIFAFFLSVTGWSQQLDFVFKGVVENSDLAKKEAGVTVSIVQGGKTIATTSTASNGKYGLVGNVNYGTPFDVVFSKSGLVSKRVKFDLSKMNVEDIPPGNEFRPIEALDMTMFKERENVDFSFLNTQPVGTFDWNTRGMSVRLDQVEKNEVQAKILALLEKADKDRLEAEQKYQAAIQQADVLYNEKNYEEALAKYEEALGYKPAEKYPADRIVELDALIQAKKREELAQQQQDAEYNNLISAADNLRDQKNLEGAIAKYKEALTKKDEQYPKDQIENLEIAIEKQKREQENQAKYDEAIQMADGFLKQNSLRAARDKYTEATKLKPSEQYPKDKLAEINEKLDAQAAIEEKKKKYNDAVAAADALFSEEKFAEAKSKYEEALTYESAATYPKGRIDLCDEKLLADKAEKERLEKIEALMKKGKEQIASSDWVLAEETFQEVLTLETEHVEAKEKLAFVQQKVKEESDLAAQEKKYNDLLAEGDQAFNAESYENALAKYQEAKNVKTTPEVEEKITKTNAKLGELKALADKEGAYKAAMEEGESMLGIIGDINGAKVKFQEALALFPDRELPKQKIAEIDKLLAEQAANQEQKAKYDAAIAKADGFFASEKWEDAKSAYTEAQSIDNEQAYPAERIAAIETKLAELAALNDQKAKYDAAIAKADGFFASEKWEDAKSAYTEAQSIDSEQAYPAERIAAIETKLAELAALNDQKAKYDAAIAKADGFFASEKWEDAKSAYTEAQSIDSEQAYPAERIAAIETKLAELAALNNQKAMYDAAIQEGDRLLGENQLEAARAKYNEALAIDGAQSYPSEKIKEINDLIAQQSEESQKIEKYNAAIQAADALFTNGDWTEAKAKYNEAISYDNSKTYPGERIREIETLIAADKEVQERKANYEAAIRAADHAFNEANWDEAAKKYREAMSFDSSQSYPNQRLSEIELKIEEQQSSQAQQAQIAQLLSEGKSKFNAKDFSGAKEKFQQVLELDNNNSEAASQLNLIAAELAKLETAAEQEARFDELKKKGFEQANNQAYEQALSTLNEALRIKEDTEVSEKLAELNVLLAERSKEQEEQEKYADLLSQAASFEQNGAIQKAINQYKEALSIRPSEAFPKQKIEELEIALENEQAQEAINREYNAFMSKGDQLVAEKKYLEAIQAYNEALAIKPNEQEPVDKAKEAERLEKALASEGDEQYEKILTVAQTKMEGGEYDKAEELVERAQKLKPQDTRPQEMLNEISRLKKLDAEYAQWMSEGDKLAASQNYKEAIQQFEKAQLVKPSESAPAQRIAEMEKALQELSTLDQKKSLYEDFMNKGRASQEAKSYEMALNHYKSALAALPNDLTAQNKIDEIQQILDDIEKAKSADIDRKNAFNGYVKAGDAAFASENYLLAKGEYQKALEIDPSSTYVRTQMDECVRLEREKSKEQAEKEYKKIIAAGDKYFDLASYEKSKGYYQRALSFKSDDPYPKRRLAEIEGILNPVSLNSGELEDLGDPFSGSILDGAHALRKAEEERVARKKLGIQTKYEVIASEDITRTSKKQQEHYDNSNAIYQVQQKVYVKELEYDANRESIVEALKSAETERTSAERNNYAFEKSENLSAQDLLYGVSKSSNIDYKERESVYTENAEALNTYNSAQAVATSNRVKGAYDQNINADQQLSGIKKSIDQGVVDDYNERAETERDVVRARNYAIETGQVLSKDRYDVQLENKKSLYKVEASREEKGNSDRELAHTNNEDLVNVRAVVVAADYEQGQVRKEALYKASEDMGNVKERVREDEQDLNSNRLASVELMKETSKTLAEAEYEKYNSESTKHIKNKAGIDKEVTVNAEINDVAKEAHAKKVAYVNAMDDKAKASRQDGVEGDYEERLKARKSVESVYGGVQENSSEAAKKVEQNAADISDLNKTLAAQDHAKKMGQQEKHYDNQKKLSQVDGNPPKKVKVSNELGKEYPEGVSQESFTRSDENGLMTAVITRRIVVIDGHADVYVRTQTLNGITYSKNGKPSLAHVWSKETQGPHLERHY